MSPPKFPESLRRESSAVTTGGKLSDLTSAEETKAQSNLTGLEKVRVAGLLGWDTNRDHLGVLHDLANNAMFPCLKVKYDRTLYKTYLEVITDLKY